MPIPTGDAALLFADDLEAITPILAPSARPATAPAGAGAFDSGSLGDDGLSREERERLVERARLRMAERSRAAIAEADGGQASDAGSSRRRRGRRRPDDAAPLPGLAGLRPQLDARPPHTSIEMGRLVERFVLDELTRDEAAVAAPAPASADNAQLVVRKLVTLHERLAARAAVRNEQEASATDASSAEMAACDDRGLINCESAINLLLINC